MKIINDTDPLYDYSLYQKGNILDQVLDITIHHYKRVTQPKDKDRLYRNIYLILLKKEYELIPETEMIRDRAKLLTAESIHEQLISYLISEVFLEEPSHIKSPKLLSEEKMISKNKLIELKRNYDKLTKSEAIYKTYKLLYNFGINLINENPEEYINNIEEIRPSLLHKKYDEKYIKKLDYLNVISKKVKEDKQLINKEEELKCKN